MKQTYGVLLAMVICGCGNPDGDAAHPDYPAPDVEGIDAGTSPPLMASDAVRLWQGDADTPIHFAAVEPHIWAAIGGPEPALVRAQLFTGEVQTLRPPPDAVGAIRVALDGRHLALITADQVHVGDGVAPWRTHDLAATARSVAVAADHLVHLDNAGALTRYTAEGVSPVVLPQQVLGKQAYGFEPHWQRARYRQLVAVNETHAQVAFDTDTQQCVALVSLFEPEPAFMSCYRGLTPTTRVGFTYGSMAQSSGAFAVADGAIGLLNTIKETRLRGWVQGYEPVSLPPESSWTLLRGVEDPQQAVILADLDRLNTSLHDNTFGRTPCAGCAAVPVAWLSLLNPNTLVKVAGVESPGGYGWWARTVATHRRWGSGIEHRQPRDPRRLVSWTNTLLGAEDVLPWVDAIGGRLPTGLAGPQARWVDPGALYLAFRAPLADPPFVQLNLQIPANESDVVLGHQVVGRGIQLRGEHQPRGPTVALEPRVSLVGVGVVARYARQDHLFTLDDAGQPLYRPIRGAVSDSYVYLPTHGLLVGGGRVETADGTFVHDIAYGRPTEVAPDVVVVSGYQTSTMYVAGDGRMSETLHFDQTVDIASVSADGRSALYYEGDALRFVSGATQRALGVEHPDALMRHRATVRLSAAGGTAMVRWRSAPEASSELTVWTGLRGEAPLRHDLGPVVDAVGWLRASGTLIYASIEDPQTMIRLGADGVPAQMSAAPGLGAFMPLGASVTTWPCDLEGRCTLRRSDDVLRLDVLVGDWLDHVPGAVPEHGYSTVFSDAEGRFVCSAARIRDTWVDGVWTTVSPWGEVRFAAGTRVLRAFDGGVEAGPLVGPMIPVAAGTPPHEVRMRSVVNPVEAYHLPCIFLGQSRQLGATRVDAWQCSW